MPKLHAYESKPGVYIQTKIDESPQTLQVAPSAATLFEDLGFGAGEYIPRDATKPLIILGVLATKPHGRSKWDLLAGIPRLSLEYCELDETQQETLREYLQQRVGDLTGVEYERLSEFIEDESPLEPLPHTFDSSTTATPSPTTELPAVPSDIGINLTGIPTALRQRDTWLCWRRQIRDGKPTKVPISPHDGDFGKVNDPATWASFEVAVDALSQDGVDGLGYVFTDDDTIAGIDIDDVRDPETGTLTERADAIVEQVDSYTEISPSGTGLHVLLKGFVPEGRQRHDGIELYDKRRFFTVTGHHVEETPTEVAVRHAELTAVHETYVARTEDTDSAPDHNKSTTVPETPQAKTDLEEERIIEYGQRSSTFRQLWDGNTATYQSHSEADLALCVLLAYYTGDDTAVMDRLFRRSGLMREKWDEMRGDQTYGELTIEKAVQYVDSYDPHLHGIEAAASKTDIAGLETNQKATIEATVAEVEAVPADEIEQAGELTDDTSQIRFVVWDSDYWSLDAKFIEGKTYRLADVWVTEYQGQRELHINEHTAIESIKE